MCGSQSRARFVENLFTLWVVKVKFDVLMIRTRGGDLI